MILNGLPSVDTPIRYFGAKTKARRMLGEFIPTDVREVLSPFIGGGALELYLTARGVRVHGSDAFPPLANFWQALLDSPDRLCAEIRRIVADLSQDTWREDASRFVLQDSGCRITDAAQCLIVYNFSFNNMGLRNPGCVQFFVDEEGVPRRAQDWCRNRRLILYERIEGFTNELLSVECLDFREAFAKHPDVFAYCDPPYPAVKGVYGDSPEYHESFDHAGLAALLGGRERWLLSYNDTEQIRDLYPEDRFEWVSAKWKQAGKNHSYRGNEVIILPKS